MRGTMMGVRAALTTLALVVLAACGDGEGDSGALATLGVKDGASRGVSKSVEVSPDANASIKLSTGALLQVPKGAVDKALTVTMERPADSKALDLVQRFKSDQDRIASAPYVLKPHGTKFKEEVTLTLPLAKTGSREQVEVAWLENENDTEWKKLGVAKSDGKTAQITLKHFSVLVIVEDASDLRPVDGDDEPDTGSVAGDAGSASNGGTSRDGGDVDGEFDAAPLMPVEADASIEGGTEMDAGTGNAEGPDGAVQVGQPDASGSSDSDAGDSLPDAGGGFADGGLGDASPPPDAAVEIHFAQAFYNKLESCGYVVNPGDYSFAVGPGSVPECEFKCYASGTCDDVVASYCGFPNEFTTATAACLGACRTFTCANGTSTGTRCNETAECPDGEDELHCSGTFTCGSGEAIDYNARCNWYEDCLDGSDEQGCFTCDEDSLRLPPEAVCDYSYSCSDGSDEPTSCATVTVICETPSL